MKAKKIIICILTATVFLAGTVQALDYDERRILFGENYAQIEKIAAGSVPVLKANLSAVKKNAETFHRDYSKYALEEPVFFREKAGSTVFYRAIFGIREASFPAFAIENLHAANNRIKTFTLNDVEHNFFDIFPNGYAYFPAGGEKSVTLRSSSVFKGSRFSDTCIADIIVE